MITRPWQRLLCWAGFHRWRYRVTNYPIGRVRWGRCTRCGREDAGAWV